MQLSPRRAPRTPDLGGRAGRPSRTDLTRRGLLGLGAAAGAAVALGVAAPAGAAVRGPKTGTGRPGGPLAGEATAFLRAMTEAYPQLPAGPTLPQSYADDLGLFSTAFVYDSALAVCAALAVEETALARRIGDGLVFAQEHDPVYADGRLRQAYNTGPFVFYDGVPNAHGLVLPDGTANIGWQFGFLGTAVGDMAWPGIALVHLHARTGVSRYLTAARRIGEWILARAVNSGALGGFSFGVDGADARVPNCSTEHNIDCVAFFGMLAEHDPDPRWGQAAVRARAFVERMWEPTGGFFYTGSNDGSTVNPSPLPLDPQTWSWLALRAERFAPALDWAATALAVTDDAAAPYSTLPDGVAVSGVTFSSASLTSTASYNGVPVNPRGVWLEGTAQLACAFADRRAPRDRGRVDALLAQTREVQREVGAGQRVGGVELGVRGLVAASSLIDSGFGFGYFPVQHTGATAWYLMADRAVNPMQPGGLG